VAAPNVPEPTTVLLFVVSRNEMLPPAGDKLVLPVPTTVPVNVYAPADPEAKIEVEVPYSPVTVKGCAIEVLVKFPFDALKTAL